MGLQPCNAVCTGALQRAGQRTVPRAGLGRPQLPFCISYTLALGGRPDELDLRDRALLVNAPLTRCPLTAAGVTVQLLVTIPALAYAPPAMRLSSAPLVSHATCALSTSTVTLLCSVRNPSRSSAE